MTLRELAPLKALQRLHVSTRWSTRTSNATVVALAAGLSALTSLTYLAVCGANMFAVETPAAAQALLGRLAHLWIGTLRTRCAPDQTHGPQLPCEYGGMWERPS